MKIQRKNKKEISIENIEIYAIIPYIEDGVMCVDIEINGECFEDLEFKISEFNEILKDAEIQEEFINQLT